MTNIWRYHFRDKVQDEEYVDRGFAPHPMYNQPGGIEGIEANVLMGSSTHPVFIPWSNITYVERVA